MIRDKHTRTKLCINVTEEIGITACIEDLKNIQKLVNMTL